MAEKKEEFVISDRRRFAPEGDLRTDVPAAEEEKAVAPPKTPPPAPATPVETKPAESVEEVKDEMPVPPTAAEQLEQSAAYQASGKKMNDMLANAPGSKGGLPEMTFERLVESFYMSALFQLGAIRQEGEPMSVDIVSARQTIDSLSLIQEKTKGNLSDREQVLLQNVLFELRMTWIEITNTLASPPKGKPGAGGPLIEKK
jgi:hypothetical protein